MAIKARNAIHLLRESLEHMKEDMEKGVVSAAAIMEAERVLEQTKTISYELSETQLAYLLGGK